MGDSLRPAPPPGQSSAEKDRLDSWKEIAAHLGREVRTVQLWEKSEALPVHRHQHARQSSVYALKSELDAWREARKCRPDAAADQPRSRVGLRVAVTAGAAVVFTAIAIAGFLVWKNRSAQSSREALSSVVVLPFLDLSPQRDQEYFSDGLTEEIIDALSRVPNLRVVARTSAFALKGKANDVRRIGHDLNVSAVLEGSVRKSGEQLRITAQLNRAADGYHLWSRTYDRQLRDVFAVQREISQSIADQLRAGDVPQRDAPRDLAAYGFYQEGRYFFNKHEPPDSYWKAIERYQKAIQIDPGYALAYAGTADAYAYLAENFGLPPKEVMPKARDAANKAVALNPNLAEAHASLGIVKLDFEWDRAGAQRELERAMQLSPGSGYVHHWYAHSLEAQGRLPEAMKEMRASLALDPLSLPVHWDIGNELLAARKWDEALQFAGQAKELFPNHPWIVLVEALAHYHKGEIAPAVGALETLKTAHPEFNSEPVMMAFFAAAEAWQGHREEAQRTLDQLERLRRSRYVEPLMMLELCAALHDHKQLMVWVRRAYEEHSALFLYAPMMAYMHNDDPEVKAFVASAIPAT
jgi:TolB-like protein/Tfp pilus assembly protein PilF